MGRWCAVAALSELEEGRGAVIEREGACLAVFRVGGRVHALDNRCPHREGDLGAGDLSGGRVYCPLHAWPFDLETGQSPTHPGAQVRVYPCRIQEGRVEVLLDLPPSPDP